ncbi:MAG: RNA methyltransferase [Pyrinomonadaceae bacterium]
MEITSKDNSRLKHARAVRDGREKDWLFIEGLRLAEELAASNLEVTDFFFTPEFAANERGANLLAKFPDFRGAVLSEKLLESISDTKTPQGMVVLASKPATGRGVLSSEMLRRGEEASLLVILHKLNNPANIGAILRTAEAAGCSGAILTSGSADVFSPRSLRGSMGSAFRLPLWTNAAFGEAIEFCRAHKIKTVCAELNARKAHTEIDWTCARALIVGSEADGLALAEIALTDESIQIQMQPPVESLNVAVACGVILYEAARQRQFAN